MGLKRAGPLEGGWSRNWNAANKIQIQIITASWVGLDGGWSLYYEGGYSCKTFFRPKIQSKIHTMTTNRAGSAWKCVIHRCYGQGHETNGLLGKTLTQNQGTDIDSGNHFGNEFVCIELFSGPCAVFVIHVPVLQSQHREIVPLLDNGSKSRHWPRPSSCSWTARAFCETPSLLEPPQLEIDIFDGSTRYQPNHVQLWRLMVDHQDEHLGKFLHKECLKRPNHPSQNGIDSPVFVKEGHVTRP